MLSASVDRSERGDESKVCNSLTNYVRWDSRVPRDVHSYKEETEDVDLPGVQAQYRYVRDNIFIFTKIISVFLIYYKLQVTTTCIQAEELTG